MNGIKIAFLNFAENEWSTTFGDKAGANPIDPVLNYNQIVEAKSIADKVIVICHGGHEMYNLPSPRMKKLFRFYVDSGADAIVNHHTHVMSGYEVYKGAPIFYSLGNFLFDSPHQRKAKWNKGMSLVLEISEKSISFKIYTFSQCDNAPVLILHKGITAQEVVKEIELLNLTIADDTLLEKSFNKYVKENIKQYSYYIEPHGNRYLNALRNRNLFPSLWSKQKKLYLLNLIRCESHRDVLLSMLSK
jgi:poly-gamma-glutamate synthesis protein (capsule biosynthesis protein)